MTPDVDTEDTNFWYVKVTHRCGHEGTASTGGVNYHDARVIERFMERQKCPECHYRTLEEFNAAQRNAAHDA